MLGTVLTLRRYPVKSMLGEDIAAADVTASGIARDRRLALVHDLTGKVVSAKYPRLWRDMLLLHAAAADGPDAAAITFPGGRTVLSTDARADEQLSRFLGHPVTLTATRPAQAELDRAVPEAVLRDGITAQVPAARIVIGGASPAGTFFDFAPLHLITTGTLGAIAAHRDGHPVLAARYRPNLIIGTPGGGFTENGWAGRDIRIGSGLVVRIIARTPRCAVPTLVHGDGGDRDPDALRVLARHNRIEPADGLSPEPCAGVYGQVLVPGMIQAGDMVTWA